MQHLFVPVTFHLKLQLLYMREDCTQGATLIITSHTFRLSVAPKSEKDVKHFRSLLFHDLCVSVCECDFMSIFILFLNFGCDVCIVKVPKPNEKSTAIK